MPFPSSSIHDMLKALLDKLRTKDPPPAKPDKLAAYPDFGPDFRQVVERVQPCTMSSPDRMAAMYEAARYVARCKLPGALVECGVWKAHAREHLLLRGARPFHRAAL